MLKFLTLEKMRYANLFIIPVAGISLAWAIIHFSTPNKKSPNDITNYRAQVPEPIVQASVPLPSISVTSERDSTVARFLAADPDDTEGQLGAFLDNLCRSGQCSTAIALANEAPTNLQAGFLKIIFSRWGQSHPEDAIKSLNTVTDPQLHSAALRALADAWNSRHPGDLAAYAFGLPPNADRDYALNIALNNWSQQDPAALGQWLNTLPPGSEFDNGAALMLQKSDAENRSPEVAMAWVENISDPTLKQNAFQRIFTEWIQSDPDTAQQYLASASWLSAPQRSQILETLSNPQKTAPASE